MIRYEDECVGCPPNMGCLGDRCKYRNVPYYFCDICGDESDPEEMRDVDGYMYCESCFDKYVDETYPTISV